MSTAYQWVQDTRTQKPQMVSSAALLVRSLLCACMLYSFEDSQKDLLIAGAPDHNYWNYLCKLRHLVGGHFKTGHIWALQNQPLYENNLGLLLLS